MEHRGRGCFGVMVICVAVLPIDAGEAATWTVRCKKDVITDHVNCTVADRHLMLFFDNSDRPTSVCIYPHDFPGRQAVVRISKGQPHYTTFKSCMFAYHVFDEMLLGTKYVVQFTRWPYDFPVDGQGSLKGLGKAIKKVSVERDRLQ